jgi:hypothetical protein
MLTYTVTLWNAEGEEAFLTHDGTTTTCDACATRFIDTVTAEAAAMRAMQSGWAYAIEEEDL